MMKLNILRAGLEHTASIARMNQMMALETEAKSLAYDDIFAGVTAVMQDPSLGFYLVACEASSQDPDDAVLACLAITYEWSDWRNGLFWWIQSVYVNKQHRSKGIFRQMYQAVTSLARQDARICGLRLYVEKANQDAIRTYLGIGMTETDYRLMEEMF